MMFFSMKVKKYAIYAQEVLSSIKIRKNLKYIKKLEIIVIIQENFEELLIVFVTYDTKYPKKFL